MGAGVWLSGGRLISMACGVRKTVVTMKKISSRNATSTIGRHVDANTDTPLGPMMPLSLLTASRLRGVYCTHTKSPPAL